MVCIHENTIRMYCTWGVFHSTHTTPSAQSFRGMLRVLRVHMVESLKRVWSCDTHAVNEPVQGRLIVFPSGSVGAVG